MAIVWVLILIRRHLTRYKEWIVVMLMPGRCFHHYGEGLTSWCIYNVQYLKNKTQPEFGWTCVLLTNHMTLNCCSGWGLWYESNFCSFSWEQVSEIALRSWETDSNRPTGWKRAARPSEYERWIVLHYQCPVFSFLDLSPICDEA